MPKDKTILINAQWQGGADRIAHRGASEIKRLYLDDIETACVAISEDESELALKHGIIGCDVIERQTKEALARLRRENGARLFTVGGSCDADVASVLYANERYQGDLAVLWMDAHGDCNAPSESRTHLFYGMPVRALVGDCRPAFAQIVEHPLKPAQFIHLGGRDLDEAEKRFIEENRIPLIPARSTALIEETVSAIRRSGRKHLYIHLDLDVLDPLDFPHTPVPVRDGVLADALLPLLHALHKAFNLVGLGLYEYRGCGALTDIIGRIVEFGRRF